MCGLDSNQVAGDETGSKSAVRFTPRSALRYRSRADEQPSSFAVGCSFYALVLEACLVACLFGVMMITWHPSQADIRR